MKLKENNYCGCAMTKLLLTGCFKEQNEIPSQKESNQMIETVILEDQTDHTMIVDIKFDEARANTKALMYNENYTLLFEKKKNVISIREIYLSAFKNTNQGEKRRTNLKT